jgi:hypothetical protein
MLQWKRFDEPDLVARRLGTLPFELYASRIYVTQHDIPNPASGCDGHMLILLTRGSRSRRTRVESMSEISGLQEADSGRVSRP